MAEKLNLNKFKSSGVYTIEIDESGNIALPISTGRLVIGSSKKGPINSVVLLNSTRELAAVYGDLDAKLEKNGSYFHRTLDVALRQGPVYALNVLPVDDNDTAAFGTFNTESASTNTTWSATANVDSMSHFYNTQKLWYADVDMVNKWKNINLGDDYINDYPNYGVIDRRANKILSFVNLSRKEVTIWTRIANTTGYNLPVKEYYRLIGDKVEVPEFLNPDDIVANLFIEVIVVEGDWTNYLALANDPVYGQYFTEAGIIDSKIDDFTAVREVTLVTKAQGCIVPDFRDLTGSTVSIDALFNRKFATTGIYCALDYKKIDLIDLTEPAFTSAGTTESIYEQRLDLVGHGFEEQNLTEDGFDDGVAAGASETDPVAKISTLSYVKPADSTFYFATTTYAATYVQGDVYIDTTGTDTVVAVEGSRLYDACAGGFVKSGDKIVDSSGNIQYIAVDAVQTQTASGNKYFVIKAYSDIDRVTQVNPHTISSSGTYVKIVQATVEKFSKTFDLSGSYFYSYSTPSPTQLVVKLEPTLYGNTAKGETANTAAGAAYVAADRLLVDEFLKPGHFIKASIVVDANNDPVSRPRLLRIKSVTSAKDTTITSYGPSSLPVTTLSYTITVEAPYDVNNQGILLSGGTDITVVKGIKNFVKNLKGLKLPGMALDDINLYPNGSSDRQDAILDFVMEGSNLGMTLADNETVDFRYLIDSYEGQISSSSKSQLVQLAANHGKALAICNAPSIAQYERSVDPAFIDPITRLVSAEHISTGGNLDLNPSFTFGFAAGDKNGIPISSYSAYFMPNVVIFEGGKNKSIPPAMYVANAFMRKYNSGNTFSIVAGRRGILIEGEITGLEYDLTNEDRDYLEPAGFNLIVRRRGFGIMVFSNNTGYQKVRSALNNIHVREALGTIEKDIERILLNFLFDFNDAATRLRVKTLVSNYLAAVQDARGIASAEVIFDDSNNPVEVLEANAGVVDIIVDFPRGIHKFINRITITRAGGQLSSNSTGFTPSF